MTAYSGKDDIKVSDGQIKGSSVDGILRGSDLLNVGSSGNILHKGSLLHDDGLTTVIRRGGSSGLKSSVGGGPIVRKVVSSNIDGTTVIKKVVGGRIGLGESPVVLDDRTRIRGSPVVFTGRNRVADSPVVLTRGSGFGLDHSPVVFTDRNAMEDSPVVLGDRSGLNSQVVLKTVGHGGSRRESVGVVKAIDGTIDVLDTGVRRGISGGTIGVSGSRIIRGSLAGSTGSNCIKECYRHDDCFGNKVCVDIGCNKVCRLSKSSGYSR